MCGIVGYIGRENASRYILDGLQRLEYRGYDSAGLAIHRAKGLTVFKKFGKVRDLQTVLPKKLTGKVGIGHTRWATHGEPSDLNAHPHTDNTGQLALVHNGIIENAETLRNKLIEQGATFTSDTDSEVLAELIARTEAATPLEKLRHALRQVIGTYGVAMLHADAPDQIFVARNGSPVVLGIGDKEMFVASDAAAIVRYTQKVVYLDDGDIAAIGASNYEIQTLDAQPSSKTTHTLSIEAVDHDKGEHQHFTVKEICEQPTTLRQTLRGRIDKRFNTAHLGGLNLTTHQLSRFNRVKVIGCGSAHISAQLGAGFIETLARIPSDAEPAAEFRYRNPIIEADTLYIAVSQSGETYDTLAAVEEIKRKGGSVIGVVNVVGSSIARACDGGVYMHAGAEIAVVSTKTLTSTLVIFLLLALQLGRMRDLSPADGARLIDALEALPDGVEQLISQQTSYAKIAVKFALYEHAYFVGRNAGYAVAREGALKLKEVSYIHAEAYPASELKHGPLALVSATTPTVVIIPDDDMFEKNLSTIAEIKARKGPVLAITTHSDSLPNVDEVIRIPNAHALVTPILMLIPLQFLAYHCALERDCDVDQPRNLAKSVTVE